MYPGGSTPYVTIDAPDVSAFPLRVHPLEVRLLPETETAPPDKRVIPP